jgi:signal transduction histidine kinase
MDDAYVESDMVRISQVISNLLGNALKFSEEKGDIFIYAERKKEADKNVVIVSVKDTGTGVHPQMMPRLFTSLLQNLKAEVLV